MRFLLLNDNPVVTKLVTLSAQKTGDDLTTVSGLGDVDDDSYDLLIIDDAAYSDGMIDELKAKNVYRHAMYMTRRGNEVPEGFDKTLYKPFLPTDLVEYFASLDAMEDILAPEETAGLDDTRSDMVIDESDDADELQLNIPEDAFDEPETEKSGDEMVENESLEFDMELDNLEDAPLDLSDFDLGELGDDQSLEEAPALSESDSESGLEDELDLEGLDLGELEDESVTDDLGRDEPELEGEPVLDKDELLEVQELLDDTEDDSDLEISPGGLNETTLDEVSAALEELDDELEEVLELSEDLSDETEAESEEDMEFSDELELPEDIELPDEETDLSDEPEYVDDIKPSDEEMTEADEDDLGLEGKLQSLEDESEFIDELANEAALELPDELETLEDETSDEAPDQDEPEESEAESEADTLTEEELPEEIPDLEEIAMELSDDELHDDTEDGLEVSVEDELDETAANELLNEPVEDDEADDLESIEEQIENAISDLSEEELDQPVDEAMLLDIVNSADEDVMVMDEEIAEMADDEDDEFAGLSEIDMKIALGEADEEEAVFAADEPEVGEEDETASALDGLEQKVSVDPVSGVEALENLVATLKEVLNDERSADALKGIKLNINITFGEEN